MNEETGIGTDRVAVSRIIRTISLRSKIYSWALFFLYLYFLFNRVLENIA